MTRPPRTDPQAHPAATPSAGAWTRHRPRIGGTAVPPTNGPAAPGTHVTAPGPVPFAPVALDGAGTLAEFAAPPRPSPGTPRSVGDVSAADREPVRLVAPTAVSPFAPGREVAFARVEGDLLSRLGVRDGDHVALWRHDSAEPGDLAAVLDATGRAGLWRVYPERDELRLTTGDPACARRSGRRPRVQGVVVAVHRSFQAPVAARERRPPPPVAVRGRPSDAAARPGVAGAVGASRGPG